MSAAPLKPVPPPWSTATIRGRKFSWPPMAALGLLLVVQVLFLPQRLSFLSETLTYASIEDPLETARRAYRPADYDLLAWTAENVAPASTILLVSSSPKTYGDPAYVLYHRAIYHLYPRTVAWAAPVPANRFPAWWTETDLGPASLLKLADQMGASAILAEGFSTPPVAGQSQSFDADTHLVALGGETASTSATLSGLQAATWHISTADSLRVIGALLSLLAWGDLLWHIFMGRASLGGRGIRLATAWLLGWGITSLGMFAVMAAGLSLSSAVTTLAVTGAALWLGIAGLPAFRTMLATPNHRIWPHALTSTQRSEQALAHLDDPGPLDWFRRHLGLGQPLLLITAITLPVALSTLAALVTPLTAWDSWVNWAGKANILMIDQALSSSLYNDPGRLPTNLDYPLMLPMAEAWFYSWMGRIHEPSAGLISVLSYGALLLLFHQVLRLTSSPTASLGFTALLATAPHVSRAAHSGMADVPMAALVLLCFLLLASSTTSRQVRTDRSLQLRSALLLGLAAGLLPWLKNEGWLWLCLLTLTWAGVLLHRQRSGQISLGGSMVLAGSFALVAFAIPLAWQRFLAVHGTIRFTFLPLTPATAWANLDRLPEIVMAMGRRLANGTWNLGWVFVGLVLVARRGRALRAAHGWLILPVAAFLVLVSLSYLFSRFVPYQAHLNNSAERLIFQAFPLVLWWLAGQLAAEGWISQP